MRVNIAIAPQWSKQDETVSELDINITTDIPLIAGKRSLAYIRELVTIPFCPIGSITVTDAKGGIVCREEDGEPEMSFVYRRFLIPERDSHGTVTISYEVKPRRQPEGYRSSPYFDLVAERGGANGSGTTFLITPADLDSEAEVSLTWNLSNMPEDSQGVCSFGEGNVTHRMSMSELLFSPFMVGQIHSCKGARTGFYWFDKLPFDGAEASRQIELMFGHMSEMFDDKGGPYRVFARHNAFPSGGGTAFSRSYIFGYSSACDMTIDDLRSLLAHEMVHNWPTMRDEPPGTGTWYVEGSAEYYSTMVPMEMGLTSLEETAKVIDEKAGSYFDNPMMGLSNLELGKRYWTDRRCQRLPYARGILFLSNVDAQMRRATNGRATLLGVERKLLKLAEPTPQDFLDAVRELSGLDLTKEYEQMCSGGPIEPDPDAFGGHFKPVRCMVHINDGTNSTERIEREEMVPGWKWQVRETEKS